MDTDIAIALAHGYVGVDDLLQAQVNGRLHHALESAGLRVCGNGQNEHDVSGFTGCIVSRGGAGIRLPDDLRNAIEAHRSRRIRQRGLPVDHRVIVERHRVTDGLAFGNSQLLRSIDGGARAIELGRRMGVITDSIWKGPHLKSLGFDLDRRAIVYEYVGECRV